MPQSTLEMAKDLVLAQIQSGTLAPEDMQEALGRTYQSLMTLKSREEAKAQVSAAAAGTAPAPMDWPQSITQHAITCLECGQTLKQLSRRHLREHGLNARSYRTKLGIPETQPLSARATAAKRRRIAAEVRPWEKAPAYLKGQEQKAAAAKKSGRKRSAGAKRKAQG